MIDFRIPLMNHTWSSLSQLRYVRIVITTSGCDRPEPDVGAHFSQS
jgi:hypothetical protein